ncbi:MAG: mandelate racemase/muconate lactonizing enzyme family protein [Candidatus Tectomicrobia bacterium]|uniref:Mandelate racemase/muconate lactonizing enzyme family protein n=1 Tax=Tectimicrobiota bacterium TaxID=2528274 RepID=A0A937W2H9_UNCTE|nr:mandelate racemase/muconate lactonizing enzyme family protein [Candidatus Tectomicrobia bacterium]
MRIERAEVIPLEVPLTKTFYGGTYSMNRRCTLLLRVWTSDGLRGQIYIGDERDHQATVCRILREQLFPNILGRQASDVTAIWEEHFQHTIMSANRRSMMQALSALDVVLWDLLGRQAGLPVFRLLGAAQTRLQTIIIGGYYAEGKGVEGLIDEMFEYREAGYAGVKFKVGGRPPEEDIARVSQVRKAIGDDFIIACDANMGYSVADATTFARGVADCHIAWFEEPVHWYDQVRGMQEVRAATGIRITAGQSEMQRWACRDLVEGGAVDILNTDMSLAGGVTEWRRVAAHAASHRVQMAHHEEPLLSMHLLASTTQGLYPEYFAADRDPVGAYLPTMAPPLRQGWVDLPETPGFGIEVDEAFVQRYRADR